MKQATCETATTGLAGLLEIACSSPGDADRADAARNLILTSHTRSVADAAAMAKALDLLWDDIDGLAEYAETAACDLLLLAELGRRACASIAEALGEDRKRAAS
jgi:hypothetical protein